MGVFDRYGNYIRDNVNVIKGMRKDEFMKLVEENQKKRADTYVKLMIALDNNNITHEEMLGVLDSLLAQTICYFAKDKQLALKYVDVFSLSSKIIVENLFKTGAIK